MTWNEIARLLPEFVAWAVAKHGPLPDGPVQEAEYERLRAEWESGS